ncbi:hypothetical protein BDW60DRAFT_120753 [Aspergillus nidulans var. acristatus]
MPWVWVAMLFGIHVGHLQQIGNIAIHAWPLPGTRDKGYVVSVAAARTMARIWAKYGIRVRLPGCYPYDLRNNLLVFCMPPWKWRWWVVCIEGYNLSSDPPGRHVFHLDSFYVDDCHPHGQFWLLGSYSSYSRASTGLCSVADQRWLNGGGHRTLGVAP